MVTIFGPIDHQHAQTRQGFAVQAVLGSGLVFARPQSPHPAHRPDAGPETTGSSCRRYFGTDSPIAKIVNVRQINLQQVPEGYKDFNAGVANKFVIDPHGQTPKAA